MFNIFKNLIQKKMNQSFIAGFTLAEIIIVVGIIGVVAQFTIPNLVKNYQKNVTVTKLQKVYTELYQAVNLSIADNGQPRDWEWGTLDLTGSTNFAEKYIIPYLLILQNCGYTYSAGVCRPTTQYYLNNNNMSLTGYKIVLKDGTSIRMHLDGSSGNSYYFWLIVDINGNQKPNIMGKDIFWLGIFKNDPTKYFKFVTFSGVSTRTALLDDASYGCNKTATSWAGGYCGALIQLDGWKIGEGYPWD